MSATYVLHHAPVPDQLYRTKCSACRGMRALEVKPPPREKPQAPAPPPVDEDSGGWWVDPQAQDGSAGNIGLVFPQIDV